MPDAAEEDRIFADMRRRLRWRGLLLVLVCAAVMATEFVLIMDFHMVTWPVTWPSLLPVISIGVLVAVAGVLGVAWLTRLPPEALSTRMTLRHSDSGQRLMSRLYLFYPLIMGVFAFNAAVVIHRVIYGGWQIMDVLGAFTFTACILGYVQFLTGGWRRDPRTRLIFDEELFRSFRTRGYVAGFWSVLVGLVLVLALGLARPVWAVEALPFLIAVGISAPALTIALLNRRAERDA